MSLDLTTATARIARELGESEVAIADALAKTTALLNWKVSARCFAFKRLSAG